MPRPGAIVPSGATGKRRSVLEGVNAPWGFVLNVMQTTPHGPATFDGSLAFDLAPSTGLLVVGQRVRLALTVSGLNACECFASAHTAVEQLVRLDTDTGVRDRFSESTDADVAQLREAGFDDENVVGIAGNLAMNVFSKIFNNAAESSIDFLVAALLASSAGRLDSSAAAA